MQSIQDFFHFYGYAFYVWGSYGVTFGFMAIEVYLVLRNKRTITKRIARMLRMSSGSSAS